MVPKTKIPQWEIIKLLWCHLLSLQGKWKKYWFLYFTGWLHKPVNNTLIQGLGCNIINPLLRLIHSILKIKIKSMMAQQPALLAFVCNLFMEGRTESGLRSVTLFSCSPEWSLHTVLHCECLWSDPEWTLLHCRDPVQLLQAQCWHTCHWGFRFVYILAKERY